jgi:N4-gp56 family major capsid protein
MAGQLFSVNSLGGFFASFNLSKELRMGVQATSKFRQFADVKDAWGKVTRNGQTFTWDTVPMITRGSRALVETNTMPQGQTTIVQGTLTMSERGFSVPYTELLESLSMVSVRQPIMKVLKYDAMVDLDCLVHQQFNKTPLRVVSTSSADTAFTITTNSTATATNTTLISKINVRAIVDGMKGRNIPFYNESDYYAIARPGAYRLLKNDLESVHQYTESGLTMILNGEIGRYEDTRFVEQTVVPTGGAADSTTFDPFTDTGDAWNTAGAGDWVFFFGADTVTEAVHTPEEIRAKMPDDYGRSKGIAWYALLGYGLAHGFTTDTDQARIVKFDSAV